MGRYTRQLLASLAGSRDVRFVLFARPDAAQPDFADLPDVQTRIESIEPVETPPVLPWGRLFRFVLVRRAYHVTIENRHRGALARAVRRTRPDLLHLPSLTETDYFADAGGVCPSVATLHDLIPLLLRADYLDHWMPSTREMYRRQIAGFARVNAVAGDSQSAQSDGLRLLGLAADRVRVVYPAIRVESLLPSTAAQTVAFRYDITGPFFLYASGAGANKNLPRTLAGYTAYARSAKNPLPLVLAGKMPPDIVELVNGLVNVPVCLLGFVPDADLFALMQCARAVVIVSRAEGFGLPAAEAMARGTTVLAGNNSSLPEVVSDVGLLVDANSENEIAGGFCYLAKNPEWCRQQGERGRAYVAEKFNPQVQRDALLSLYAGVLK